MKKLILLLVSAMLAGLGLFLALGSLNMIDSVGQLLPDFVKRNAYLVGIVVASVAVLLIRSNHRGVDRNLDNENQ